MKLSVAVLLATTAVVMSTPLPPGIPDPSDAQSDLESLQVADSGSGDGYTRALFPHWIKVDGACTSRDEVLKRDGDNVQTNSRCTAESGTWTSPYDGLEFTKATQLDIDHLVPLENAWISGASSWTTDQRKAFANDLERPQLYAVSEHANRQKGDQSPDLWMPPLQSFQCTYAESWVTVKSFYNLTITSDEKTALSNMLGGC